MIPYKLIIITISTFFFCGYFPLVPGTFASFIGMLIFLQLEGIQPYYWLVLSCCLVVGFLVCGKAEKIFGKKDPSNIVIDEVCGMLLSFMFVPVDLKLAVTGFILFRIFDALKPFPLSGLQNLRGSLGIMGDDIMAGLYTNLVLQVVLRLISLSF